MIPGPHDGARPWSPVKWRRHGRAQVTSRVLNLSRLPLAILPTMTLLACPVLSRMDADVPSAINDGHLINALTPAELVFIGTLERRHQSDCAPSGIAVSRQKLTFQGLEASRGNLPEGRITVAYTVLGSGPLEVHRRGCHQLSPEIFRRGNRFIVAIRYNASMKPDPGWELTGGPWSAASDSRNAVVDGLTRAASPVSAMSNCARPNGATTCGTALFAAAQVGHSLVPDGV